MAPFPICYNNHMKSLKKFGTELHKHTLKNGAKVFLFKRKGMPIYLRAMFYAGSRFDEITGSAHFLEHMLVAGTVKFPSKNLIADYIQNVGGEFGAITNGDFLKLNVEIPESADIGVGVDVLNECLTNSLFELKTIENERGSIFSELNGKRSAPAEYIWEVFNRVAFQGTKLERSVIGNEQEVGSINKAALLKHKNNYINSGRVCFIAAGDIEIDELAEKLETIKLPTGNGPEANDRLPIIKSIMQVTEHYPGVSQLQILIGCRTTVQNYKELCALQALNMIIAIGRGSRLATKLRYEKGLVYSVSGNLVESGDWGLLRFKLSCSKKNWKEAEDIIYQQFTDIRENGVTQTELNTVKARISKGLIRSLQTSESWVREHDAEAFFALNDLHTANDYIETVGSLTSDEIKDVANKYLIRENFYTAICGDTTNDN